MAACHFWRLQPAQWFGAGTEDKARMMAYRIVNATLEAWHYEAATKAAERNSGSPR